MYFYHFDFNGLTLFSYARRSSESDERQVASIDSQEKFIFKRPDGSPEHIEHHFKEKKSAKKKGIRKEFYHLLDAVRQAAKQGKRCGIKVWDLSRLSRNLKDSAEIMDMMFEEEILACVITHGGVFTNLESPEMMSNEFSRAYSYIVRLRRVVNRGMEDKAERGWYPATRLKAGYKHRVKYKRGEDEIIPDQPNFSILQELDQALLSGAYTVPQIKELAEQKGLLNPYTQKHFTMSFYYKFFTDSFYHEGFTWKGIYYKDAKHQKLRTKEKFRQIQFLLGKHGRPRNHIPVKSFPYNQILECACGFGLSADYKLQATCTNCRTGRRKTKFSIITSTSCPKCHLDISEMNNPKIHEHIYYRCNNRDGICKQPSIKALEVETQTEKLLESIAIKKDFADLMRKYLLIKHQEEHTSHAEQLQSLRTQKEKLEQEESNLVGLRIGNQINDQHYTIHNKRIKDQMEVVDAQIVEAESTVSDWHERVILCVNFGEKAVEAFRNGNEEIKRKILLLFGSRLKVVDGQIHFSLPKALFYIKAQEEKFVLAPSCPEPLKKPYEIKTIGDFSANLASKGKNCPEPHIALGNKAFALDMRANFSERPHGETLRTLLLLELHLAIFYKNLAKSEEFKITEKQRAWMTSELSSLEKKKR